MRHFAVLAALVAACGGEALPRVCESGRTQACACVGGGQGAQVCALSGLSWGACVCGDGGAADAPADAPTDVAGGDASPDDAAVGDAPIDTPPTDAPADSSAPDAAVGDIGVDTPPTDALTPNRTAYQRCDPAVDVCAAGTACVASIAQVSGKSRGTSCTVTCPSGNASSCPGYVPGAATQRVECANFTGNLAQAQCFRLCTTQNDCASDNTTCSAFMMPTGQIRVCVPAGTRI